MKLKLTTSLFIRRFLILFMKTFIFLLCSTIFAFTPIDLKSQNIDIKIKESQIVSVDEVFDIIRNQTKDYMFIYKSGLFENFPEVELEKGTIRMDALINKSLKGGNLKVILTSNNTILIKHASEVQSRTIKGTVTDKNGSPLPFVTVLVKGTTTNTSTDLDGNYEIKVYSNENVLVFRLLGYLKQEKEVGNLETVHITMEEDVAELDEVELVSTGYQKIRPEHTTGSFASIGKKEYESRVNTTDFLTGIQNKLPGVLVNNDVEFEGNNLFQIRGISTIEGNRSPLIVIDGYPTELSLESIDPNDIETITVLKDAAAATIYGVRASNGVVIIERKSGKPGKLRVNFRSTTSIRPKTDYERFRWDDNASIGQINYMVERNEATAGSLYMFMTTPGLAQAFNYPKPVQILAEQAAGIITEEEAMAQYATLGAYNNTEDYSDLFLRNAITNTFNLNISGGSENALYYLTANYNTSNSEVKTQSNDRFRLSARGNFKFSESLSLRLNTDFQEVERHSSPVPGIESVYPWERFTDDQGNPATVYQGSIVNPYYNQTLIEAGLYDNMYYPLVDMHAITDNTHRINNRLSADLNYKFGNGFNIGFGGIYETSVSDGRYRATDESSVVRQWLNRYAQQGENGPIFNIPVGSFLRDQGSNTSAFTLRAQLDFNKTLFENHSLNFIAGGELREMIVKDRMSSLFGYNDQTLTHQPVDYTLFTGGAFTPEYANSNPALSYSNFFDQGYTQDRFVSVYSNLVYSFMNKYSLTGSFRIDQSNLFGTDPKYKYKPLWSVGAAWNIDKENFLDNIYWLNRLKFRAALGFNGNVAKNSLPRIIASDGFNSDYTSMRRLSLLSPANSKLRWEQTYNTNIGLDFNVFKRISGSLEYYVKKSTDVLATNPIDNTRGVESAKVNESSIRNSGFEFTLNADWITNKTFNWNSGIVFSLNSSKILEVYNNEVTPDSPSYRYAGGNTNYLEGYPIGTVFNYRYAGIDPEDGRTLISGADGSLKHFDENNEGKDDVFFRGTIIPKYNAGLSNRLDIGNFYFYTMINYYGGFVTKIPIPNPSSVRPLEGSFNYWREPGDELNPETLSNISELTGGYRGYIDDMDIYTVDATYFTLGDVTASYSLRETQLLRKVGLSDLEVRLQASNVYTFALNDQNYSKAMGSYDKNYITPTYSFALNLAF